MAEKPDSSTLTQVVLCAIASGSMVSSGMTLAFPSVTLSSMNSSFTLTQATPLHPHQAFFIVSVPQLAMVGGCLSAGPILDWKGRRLGLLLSTSLAAAGWLWMSAMPYLWCIYGSRLLTGFAMGLANPSVSVFVSETASPATRSALTVIKAVAVSSGLTATYLFGYFYRDEWRTVSLLCGVIPTGCCLLVWAYVPESRVWKKPSVPKEETMAQLLRPEVTRPMLIISMAFFLRQISGTTAMLSYAVEVVGQAGVGLDWYGTAVGLGCTRLVGGLLVLWLSWRLGRRVVASWSGVAMSAAMLSLGAPSFRLPLFSLVMYFLTSTVHSAVPQAMVGELFPTSVRGMASSLTTVIIYLTSFLALWIHEWVRMDREVMFTYYGCLCVASTVFIILFLPETHGKTLDEIQLMFKKSAGLPQSEDAQPINRPEEKEARPANSS